jgi:hypothetical protein
MRPGAYLFKIVSLLRKSKIALALSENPAVLTE